MLKKIIQNNWFIGISCSIIASILYSIGQDVVIVPYLSSFLKKRVGFIVWKILISILFIIILFIIIKIIISSKKKFMEYKSDNWSQINWVWDWKQNKISKLYEIKNLNMLCPKCTDGIFTVATMYSRNYECVKCNFKIPTNQFPKPSHDQIRDEIYSEIRKNYPSETKYIDHN